MASTLYLVSTWVSNYLTSTSESIRERMCLATWIIIIPKSCIKIITALFPFVCLNTFNMCQMQFSCTIKTIRNIFIWNNLHCKTTRIQTIKYHNNQCRILSANPSMRSVWPLAIPIIESIAHCHDNTCKNIILRQKWYAEKEIRRAENKILPMLAGGA